MELKTCPFCGSKAELLTHTVRGYEPCIEYIVRCTKGCCTKGFTGNNTVYHTEQEAMQTAIDTWNRRSE